MNKFIQKVLIGYFPTPMNEKQEKFYEFFSQFTWPETNRFAKWKFEHIPISEGIWVEIVKEIKLHFEVWVEVNAKPAGDYAGVNK
jgi:hypothetical protein